MKKISLILSALIMIFSFCGSAVSAPGEAPANTPLAASPSPQLTPPVYESPAPPDEGIDIPKPETSPECAVPESPEIFPSPSPSPVRESSIFDLMSTTPAQSGAAFHVDMAAYYLLDMIQAAADGDVKTGRSAEDSRNAAIDASGEDAQKISFDELYLLARIIYSEAGSDWLDDEFRLCVGEVVLNRVASPEFPDNIHDVVYQKGQYTGVNSVKFANLKPGEDCVNVALRLLQGERMMVPSVVYQSDCIQGELFSMYSDRHLGNTYFCLSQNLELYPID